MESIKTDGINHGKEEVRGPKMASISALTALRIVGIMGATLGATSGIAGCDGIRDSIFACASAKEDEGRSIEDQKQVMKGLNSQADGEFVNWNVKRIANNLTEGLDKKRAMIKLFEFVQSYPYQIRPVGDTSREGVDLYDLEEGDCRHKRNALYALLESKGYEVRKVAIVFDWKDLPVPKEILDLRRQSGTRAFHSGMDVKIKGKWVAIDPTWDKDLIEAGFPVNENWDGESPMKNVTFGECTRVQHDEYEKISDLYGKFDIPYPVQSENQAFVQALNEWLKKQRK